MSIKKIKEKIYKLLRWSEKYFKTDMVYLTRGGFWLTLGQTISSLSSFLLTIAFANLLPKETYGTYKYVLSIAGILAISTLSGMSTAIIQAVARGYEGSLVPVLKTKIRWGLLGGLAGLILAGYYFYQGNITLTVSFLISAIFLPFMDSFGIYDALLQGKKLFDISTKYFIISQIIAIASLIAVLFFTKNLFFILFTYFASWVLLRFVFFKITLKKFSPNQNQDPQTISYGKHLSLMGAISTIAAYLDKILIFHYLEATEVAVYSIAIAMPNQIKSILKNVGFLILPKFSEKSHSEIKSGIKTKLFISSIFLCFIFVLYFLFAPFLFKIFFPTYKESIYYSQLYAISIIGIPKMLFRISLESQKRTKELYTFNFSISIIKIIFLLFLVSFFGIIGAVLAYLITEMISYILIWILFNCSGKTIPKKIF